MTPRYTHRIGANIYNIVYTCILCVYISAGRQTQSNKLVNIYWIVQRRKTNILVVASARVETEEKNRPDPLGKIQAVESSSIQAATLLLLLLNRPGGEASRCNLTPRVYYAYLNLDNGRTRCGGIKNAF